MLMTDFTLPYQENTRDEFISSINKVDSVSRVAKLTEAWERSLPDPRLFVINSQRSIKNRQNTVFNNQLLYYPVSPY